MNDSSYIEKRAFPRFPVSIPLRYCEPHTNDTAYAQTRDISARGLCMITEEALPPDTSLDIYLKMIDDGGEVYRKGKVVWSNMLTSNKYRVGIELEEPNLKPIPLILRTIKAQRKY